MDVVKEYLFEDRLKADDIYGRACAAGAISLAKLSVTAYFHNAKKVKIVLWLASITFKGQLKL